ncbi:hypothetical protein [Dactylosporangium sp. CA-139066]|uniref:hypothetical protein n=1 Tax=Dactylosporangium sp. CA-139066 TaxID=3239930 RepID=UPI003D8D7465
MTTQELAAAIGDRPGWRMDGAAAVYAPGAGDWTGRVRAVERPERADRSWHIAVVHRGAARHSGFGRSAADAV